MLLKAHLKYAQSLRLDDCQVGDSPHQGSAKGTMALKQRDHCL